MFGLLAMANLTGYSVGETGSFPSITGLTPFASCSLFFFDDAEGFSREIGVLCIPGIENELKFVALE